MFDYENMRLGLAPSINQGKPSSLAFLSLGKGLMNLDSSISKTINQNWLFIVLAVITSCIGCFWYKYRYRAVAAIELLSQSDNGGLAAVNLEEFISPLPKNRELSK